MALPADSANNNSSPLTQEDLDQTADAIAYATQKISGG